MSGLLYKYFLFCNLDLLAVGSISKLAGWAFGLRPQADANGHHKVDF